MSCPLLELRLVAHHLALGAPGAHCHHPPRGASAFPVVADQIKRQAAWSAMLQDESSRIQRPTVVTIAIAFVIAEFGIATSAMLWTLAALGPLNEAIRQPYFSLPLLMSTVSTVVIVALLATRRGWARYALMVVCLLAAADLLPSAIREQNTLNYQLAIAVAWASFALLVAASALLFTRQASSWYAFVRPTTAA